MNTIENNFTPRVDQLDEAKLEPVFPKASHLLFNSGNVVSSDRLKKRSNLNSQEEVNEVLNNTISNWLNTVDRSQIEELKMVQIRHPDYFEELNSTDKNDISSSVKLFLNSFDPDVLSESIRKVMEEIGVDHIDTLIISFPEKIFNQDDLPKDLILPLWSIIENHIQNRVVLNAGLADFNAKFLEDFFKILGDKNYKPTINQVNLTSCCKMPEDLVEFAKINNVQLTTHIDPMELLTVDTLQSNIRKYAHEYDANGWMHLWLARYTLILKGRGIVKSKGYILTAHRDIRYTK